MNQTTYQKDNENCPTNVQKVMHKTKDIKVIQTNTKNAQKMMPESHQFQEIGTPTFGVHVWSILDIVFSKFWTSILESILYLILDPHFEPILVPTPHKMRVPEEILRRSIFDYFECLIFEYLLLPFWMHLGNCLGRLEIIKTCNLIDTK